MNPVYIAIAAFVAVAGVIIALLLWRARKPAILPAPAAKGACCKDEPLPEPAPKRRSMRERITAVFDAIDYLRTRREWRYGMPWMLLLGEHGAGKSSTIGSVAKQNRLSDDVSATQKDELAIDGIEWHFFNQGAMIDPQGRLPTPCARNGHWTAWCLPCRHVRFAMPRRRNVVVLLRTPGANSTRSSSASNSCCRSMSW